MVLGSLDYRENIVAVVPTGDRDAEWAIVGNGSACGRPANRESGLSELGNQKPSHLPVWASDDIQYHCIPMAIMVRKTLTFLSLIGLLLSVGLWGVSYFNLLYVIRKPSQGVGQEGVRIYLSFGRIGWQDAVRYLEATDFQVMLEEGGIHIRGYLGLRTDWSPRMVTTSTGLLAAISIPLWIPGVVFGLSVLVCRPIHYLRRRKRKKRGLCIKCGYDLRGSPERCPECGTGFSD